MDKTKFIILFIIKKRNKCQWKNYILIKKYSYKLNKFQNIL